MKYSISIFLLLWFCQVADAQPVEFSIDDLLSPIENNLPLDTIIKAKLPVVKIIAADRETLIQADSINWYGVLGKFTVLLDSSKSLEHLQWDSYGPDSNTYHKVKGEFTTRFGTGNMNQDEILTFVYNGLCINIDKDKEGKFRLFLVKCRGKIR